MSGSSEGQHSLGSRLRQLLAKKEKEFTELTQSTVEELERQVHSKTVALEELELQFKELKEDFLYNEGVLQERDDEIRALESQLHRATESHTTVRKLLQEREEECSVVQSQLQVEQDRCKSLREDLKKWQHFTEEQSVAAEYKLQAAVREVRNDTQQSLVAQQQSAAEAADAAASTQQQLRLDLQQAGAALVAAEAAATAAQEMAQACSQRESTARETAADAQSSVAAAEAAAAEAGREVARLLWELETAQKAVAEAEQAAQRAQGDAAAAEQKVSAAESRADEVCSRIRTEAEAARNQRDDAMRRAIAAELHAEAAAEGAVKVRQRADEATARCEELLVSQRDVEQHLQKQLQECEAQRDEVIQNCNESRDQAQSVMKEAMDRANDVEQKVAAMEATLLEANQNTAAAVKLQEASEHECKTLRTQLSELEASLAATQKELGDARRDLITAQNNAEAMMTADAAESRDSTTFISVALQQRDAAVAAEVAAVGRAQNLQAELETLRLHLHEHQQATKHEGQHCEPSATVGNQRGVSQSPDYPESVVCTTTAGGAMMRRARFRRAVSCTKSSHSGAAATSSANSNSKVTSTLPTQSMITSHLHGNTKQDANQLCDHRDCMSDSQIQEAWQRGTETDAVSNAAELGSVRDSRALSIPDSTVTLRASPPPQDTTKPEYRWHQSFNTTVECCSTSKALEVCCETINTKPPSENDVLTCSEPSELCSTGQQLSQSPARKVQELQAALEASTAQNTQLKGSLAAMRAEIEELGKKQLSTVPDTNYDPSEHAGLVRPDHDSQSKAVAFAAEQGHNERVLIDAEAVSTALANAGDYVGTIPALQDRASRTDNHEAETAQPERDSSGPFSSMREASLRAASLHAAIMAATGGQSSALLALESTVDGMQPIQAPTVDVGLHVPELDDGDLLQGEKHNRITSTPEADKGAQRTSSHRQCGSNCRHEFKLSEQLESERLQWNAKAKELCHERDTALSRMERLQQENERLMELGAELRAEKELLVCHLPPAFVEAVCSGVSPPPAAMACMHGGVGATPVPASHAGSHTAPLPQAVCWDNCAKGLDVHKAWSSQDASAAANIRQTAHGQILHGPQDTYGAIMNSAPTEIPVQSVASTPQWQCLVPSDTHGFDFVCENLNPNVDSIGASLWVQESGLGDNHDAKDTDQQSSQFVPELLDHGAQREELSESPQQLQKGVDTSDLDGSRHEAAIVTVGGKLQEGHTGTKGMQVGVRSSAHRWPVSNSARGTTSQRTRLHALSKRRDGKARPDGAGFAPSIQARNWNVADDS